MNVGWIGLGRMGLPMSERVREAGHSVTAFVRNEGGHRRALATGHTAVSKMAALAATSDIIVSSVLDDAALLEIVMPPDGLGGQMRAGQIFLDTSTVSPGASAKVATLMLERQIEYLRAPVSGSTATAATGALTTLASGPRLAFDRALPLLSTFARKQFYVGADEQARFLKLALNAMVGATAALVAESLAISAKGGVELATALEVLCNSAVGSPLLDYKRAMVLQGEYEPAFPVTGMIKDFDLVLGVAQTAHLPLPLVALVRQQFEASYTRGHGERDFFVLIKELAELADC